MRKHLPNLINVISLAILSAIYSFFLPPVVAYFSNDLLMIVSVVFALILAFSFNILKAFIQVVTRSASPVISYSSERLLDELGDIASSTLSLKVLTQKTLKTLLKAIHIKEGAFLLIDHNTGEVVSQQQGYSLPPKLSIENIKEIKKQAKSGVLSVNDLKNNKIKQLFTDQQVVLAVPLVVSETCHGVLVLGVKRSEESYTNQDVEVLDVFAAQISMAIQNSLDYEKIRQFNITLKKEVKQSTEKLRKANKNLRHLDKLKDEFVYVATHELKNPVTAMRGYLSMISEGSFGKIPTSLQEPIHQLNQSNHQLVKLVNDLLEVARTEADTLGIELKSINICDVIEQIINSIRPLADQKKILIDYVCLEKEIMVLADSDRLKEIFNNLLTNAIKYSEKGTITIRYVQEGNQVITHIKDQGVGISKKDQKRVFTRFFRVEEEAAKGIPGSGLGLFIVRQLVGKMGGKIWFTSKLRKGSTFSFSLPKGN